MAKGTTATELRGKTDGELRDLKKEAEKSLFTARFENYTNKLDSTAKLAKLRRDIARINTLTAERARDSKKVEG